MGGKSHKEPRLRNKILMLMKCLSSVFRALPPVLSIHLSAYYVTEILTISTFLVMKTLYLLVVKISKSSNLEIGVKELVSKWSSLSFKRGFEQYLEMGMTLV